MADNYLKNRISIISFKINLCSSWYSWKIAELALNNNHSLKQNINIDNIVKVNANQIYNVIHNVFQITSKI